MHTITDIITKHFDFFSQFSIEISDFLYLYGNKWAAKRIKPVFWVSDYVSIKIVCSDTEAR